MKIEYLHSGSADCPLIRIFDFNSDEMRQLLNLFSDLTAGRVHSIALHEKPHVHCIDDCRLTLYLGDQDAGVIKVDNKSFEWRRTAEGWQDVQELVEPFLGEPKGFQWLDEITSISVLLSQSGLW